MNSDAWLGPYFAGAFLPQPPASATTGEADPMLIVGAVLDLLTARGVPVVLDHSLERCQEAAAVLLRHLGVEAVTL